MAYLILELGGERREVPISGKVTVGRLADCTVPINDKRLSREHTRVFFDGRVYRVEDLGSKNGTYLNGQLLHEARMLRPGDKIRVGDAVLTFALDARDGHLPPEAQGAPAAAPAPPAPAPADHGPRLDTARREQIVAHARAVQEAGPAGPGALARFCLRVVLAGVFGVAFYGFKLAFVWAFDRVLPR